MTITMRPRKTDTQKSAATPKKTASGTGKSAAKMRTTPSCARAKKESSPTETFQPKRASAGRQKQLKPDGGSPTITPNLKPQPSVQLEKSTDVASELAQIAKAVPGTKIVRKVVRKVIKKIPVSARDTYVRTPGIRTVAKGKIGNITKEKAGEDSKIAEAVGGEPAIHDISLVENVPGSVVEDKKIGTLGNPLKKEEEKMGEQEKNLMESDGNFSEDIAPLITYTKSVEGQIPSLMHEKEELEEEKEEQTKIKSETIGMVIDNHDLVKQEDASIEEAGNEKIEGISDQEVHEDFGGEDFADDDVPENEIEAETLDDEHQELNVAATERKARKEREIFVGGLDRDAAEEDIRKVFKYAGEVVEVRMHVDPSTNKNKGFAFVQFATKEQASYALSEMKNPVIHGKRCGTAPIEGDDTLFLGNVCNTWTKEAINQKLKDYGIEGVENITMVADPRYEGLSRGFVFIEFSCHAEAMLAYKRLQKPDVVFGHSERTAKVAFAEPQREPDPEVMAQVKSVFVDGLPPHWDEDRVREKFKGFGEIAKILLARNMSTAKRKDFGFVDFNTHEAAISCVEGVNSNGLNDGNLKVTVRARLSNPLPKMQAIKGGMCGGFRISHGSSETFPRFFGRGFDRRGQPFDRANFQYGRDFYARGPGRGGRMGASNEPEFNVPQPAFYGRLHSGRGERWGFRGAYPGPEPTRPYPERARHGVTDRGYGDYESYRRYSFEEGYDRSFMGRHFDDSYPYDDIAHRIKRPYYMMHQDSDFAEPSRHRPRLDYSDPAVPISGTRYRDDLGANGSLFPQKYSDSGYGGDAYSSFHRGERTYGRGYYY